MDEYLTEEITTAGLVLSQMDDLILSSRTVSLLSDSDSILFICHSILIYIAVILWGNMNLGVRIAGRTPMRSGGSDGFMASFGPFACV